MQDHERAYVLSMIGYLGAVEIACHPELIEDELDEAICNMSEPDQEVASGLLSLGHPRFIKTWSTTHGLTSIVDGGQAPQVRSVPCPLEAFFPCYGADLALEALKLISPIVTSAPIRTAFQLMTWSAHLDDPDFLEAAAALLEIDPHSLNDALGMVVMWGEGRPRGTAWMANRLETQFDPKDPAWRALMERAVKASLFGMMSALIKLGVNIKPLLRQSNFWGSSEWIEILDQKLSSGHGRIALMQDLPPLEDCLMLTSRGAIQAFRAGSVSTQH